MSSPIAIECGYSGLQIKRNTYQVCVLSEYIQSRKVCDICSICLLYFKTVKIVVILCVRD